MHRSSPAGIEDLRRRELASAIQRLGSDDPNLFNYAIGLVNALVTDNKQEEARSLTERGVEWIRGHPEWPATVRRQYLGTLDQILKSLEDFSTSAAAEALDLEILRTSQPADDKALSGALAEYTWTLLTAEQFTNAEISAREALPIYEKSHDSVGKFWVQSMLGESLMKQKKFTEAEPLLLSAYEGENQHKAEIPEGWSGLFFGPTMERLMNYYQATGRPEEAAKWREKLSEFNKAEAAKKLTKQ